MKIGPTKIKSKLEIQRGLFADPWAPLFMMPHVADEAAPCAAEPQRDQPLDLSVRRPRPGTPACPSPGSDELDAAALLGLVQHGGRFVRQAMLRAVESAPAPAAPNANAPSACPASRAPSTESSSAASCCSGAPAPLPGALPALVLWKVSF